MTLFKTALVDADQGQVNLGIMAGERRSAVAKAAELSEQKRLLVRACKRTYCRVPGFTGMSLQVYVCIYACMQHIACEGMGEEGQCCCTRRTKSFLRLTAVSSSCEGFLHPCERELERLTCRWMGGRLQLRLQSR